MKDRVALITGSSRGIGRCLALALAREGCNLVLTSRKAEDLDGVASDVASYGIEALRVPADLTVKEEAAELVGRAIRHFGRIDILICNAGGYLRKPVIDLTLEEIDSMLAINFYGAVYCIYPAVRQMLQQNSGHIVLVSTFDAKKGIPPDGAYSASKFAITGFVEVLRQELHGTGVSVTSVFPSRVDTTMTAGVSVPFLSPKVRPEVVAERTMRAIKRRGKEVFVPFWGPKMLQIINTFSPTASDWVVRTFGLSGRDEVPS